MSERQILQPSTAHPITVGPTRGRVVVRVRGTVVAQTDAALTLQEATYPSVQYVPLAAVDQSVLRRSDTTTYCPFKGEATYFHVTAGRETVEDVVWTYASPYPAVGDIAGHVAFYADKADVGVIPAS